MPRSFGEADTVHAEHAARAALLDAATQSMSSSPPPSSTAMPRRAAGVRIRHSHSELALTAGSVVDHFTLEKELGRGGMGVVFLARDDSLDRQVALKVIVPSAKRGEAERQRERFFREARAQAKLTSPHVVHIHYIGSAASSPADGSPPATYFAMEYVQGESLEAGLERGEALDPERGRVLLLEVAQGLRAAHEAGFIHRDIKPSNLLVDRSGHVKIADFGLAKPLSTTGPGSLTGEGVVLGTPLYMPPEQIEGAAIDHRADMYALGATFWNLLAKRPPFDDDSMIGIFAKHLNDPVPSLRAAAPAVPPQLAAIVERLMQKKREKRFATYDELIAALEAAAPNVAPPAGFAIRAAASVIDLAIGAALIGFTGPIGGALYAVVLAAAQAWRGQTLGKYLVRIRVECMDGARLTLGRSAMRLALAGWLPVYWAFVILLTRGKHDLFEGIRSAAQTDDLRGFLTAFVVEHVLFSFLYAVSLGLAAVHPDKRAVHDLVVRSRVVHVRA